MSGRDVRRVAARASTSSHHEKQQQVTRLVLGALAQGVDKIYLANEPFRINARAVENLEQRDKVEILDFPVTHTAADTETMCRLMWEAGCRVFIVLGGDGTNRIVARTFPGAIVLPLSTGTNNVFPTFVEASIAGAAAGLIASKQLAYENHCLRCKQIHILAPDGQQELALIDAVLLRNDHIGSLLPFSSDNIASVLLTRAEPASVGVSPIGGYLMPSHHADNFGVMANCRTSADSTGRKNETDRNLTVPISPGLYNDILVKELLRVDLDETIRLTGPGILAFDGDRSVILGESESAELTIRRDGPYIIEAHDIMNEAARQGLFISSTAS